MKKKMAWPVTNLQHMRPAISFGKKEGRSLTVKNAGIWYKRNNPNQLRTKNVSWIFIFNRTKKT
jgi:hypothetical protein